MLSIDDKASDHFVSISGLDNGNADAIATVYSYSFSRDVGQTVFRTDEFPGDYNLLYHY